LQATQTLSNEEMKPENAESDDGDEGWADEEVFQGIKNEELKFLSDLIEDDHQPVEDDEDLKNDPISQLDLRTYLLSFIRQCASSDPSAFATIARQLTEDEANVVQRIVAG